MYKCDTCGKFIDELPIVKQTVAFQDGEPIEETFTEFECSCGGCFCETEICPKCEESKISDDFKDEFCKECAEAIMEKFEMVMKSMFNADEIDFIHDNWQL